MKEVRRVAMLILFFVLMLGLAYPMLMTGVARVAGSKADGDIVYQKGEIVGAHNIGQNFFSDSYFHGRPSIAGSGYDAMSSGASNLGPANPELAELAQERLDVSCRRIREPISMMSLSK